MTRRAPSRFLLAQLVWIALASALSGPAAHAQGRPPRVVSDTWEEPSPGLRYLRRLTSTPTRVHVVVADLDAEGVALVATSHADRWTTVPDFAQRHDLALAINGGFWGPFQRPCGLAAGGGAPWPSIEPDPDFGTLALDDRGRVRLHLPDQPPPTDSLREAVSGRPILLVDGASAPALDDFPGATQRAPRTAVGLSRDTRTLYFVVVDGRQRDSRGMSLRELAELFIELGADRAMNLDGGGSSELYLRDRGGIASVPSRGRWEIAVDELLGSGESTRRTAAGTEVFVRGREREVMNHLGVTARAHDVAPVAHASDVGGLVPIEAPAPLPPRVRVGPFRETLALVAGGLASLFALAVLVAAARWLRARRGAA